MSINKKAKYRNVEKGNSVFRTGQKKFGFALLMAILLPLLAFSQPKDNDPYSRIGLGQPVGNYFSAGSFGGLTAAYADPLHLNYQNPASLAWLNATVFETGLYTEFSFLNYKGEKNKATSGNLSHLALAFPLYNELNDVLLKKERKFFWSMNIALMPNTNIGYDIQSQLVHPKLDTVINYFKGTGGTNKLVLGNGFKFGNFSVGFNIYHLFGQMESKRQVAFRNLEASYSDKFIDNISVRGWRWNAGLMYRVNLDKKASPEDFYLGRSLTIGAYGNGSSSFQTSSNIYRISENFSYSPIQSDTLLRKDDVEGKGTLPTEFTIGAMFEKTFKYRIGFEYGLAKWSQYENEAKPEQLYDSGRIAVGAEYTPDYSSYNNYFKRVRYRAGFYIVDDPRLESFDHYALTFGMGLPVILPRQQTSFVNLGFELGKMDTENAIKETFVKISLGFTLNDSSWFFKRKFG